MSFSAIFNANSRVLVGAVGVLVLVLGLVALVSNVDQPMVGNDLGGLSSLPEQAVQPSFEVVRINQNGSAIFTGMATPGSTVSLKLNGDHLAHVEAKIEGNWTFASGDALNVGQHIMRLESVLDGFAPSQTDEVLLIDLPSIDPLTEEALPNTGAVVFAASSSRGMRVLQRSGNRSLAGLEALPDLAPAEKIIKEPKIVAVKEVSEPLAQPVAEADTDTDTDTEVETVADIAISRIQHDPQNSTVTAEGTAEPGSLVSAMIEGNSTREAMVDSEGMWRVVVDAKGLSESRKILNIEQLREGQLINTRKVRLDTPPPSQPKANAQAKPQPTQRTEKVKPGDSLWTIAKRIYGDGTKYRLLLEANKDVLKSHKDLKPGMILRVPE